MSTKRRQFSGEFKAKIALEALKENKTINELSADFSVHPNQISQWKKELHEGAPNVFNRSKNLVAPELLEKEKAPLYEQIGRLKVELDWLKKKYSCLP